MHEDITVDTEHLAAARTLVPLSIQYTGARQYNTSQYNENNDTSSTVQQAVIYFTTENITVI